MAVAVVAIVIAALYYQSKDKTEFPSLSGPTTESADSNETARTPRATDIADLVIGRIEPGTPVEFRGTILLPSLVRLGDGSGSSSEYYVLVVPGHSPLRARLERFRRKAGVLLGQTSTVQSAIYKKKYDVFRKFQRAFASLLEGYRLLLSKSSASQAVALRLNGFDSVGERIDWKVLIGTDFSWNTPPKQLFVRDWGPPDKHKPLASIEEQLSDMSMENPPDLSTPLPKFDPAALARSHPHLLKKIQAVCSAYNLELERRSSYATDQIEDSLLLIRTEIDRDLSQKGHQIRAVLRGHDPTARDLASRVFEKAVGFRPTVYLEEIGQRSGDRVAQAFRTVSVLVTSLPEGASVSMDGHPVGTTPMVIPSVPVRSIIHLHLTLDGYEPRDQPVEIATPPSGLVKVACLLWEKHR